jgi:hypothetical protein
MRAIWLIPALLAIPGPSCEKINPIVEGEIDIYLLADHESIDPLWDVDESTLRTEDHPLIGYDEILSYDPSSHIFTISYSARQNLKGKEMEIHTRPFVLTANEKFIYTGYFWSSFSSSICPWLTIDPVHAQYTGELRVELGYPEEMDGMNIPDRRNDKRLLRILRHDGKLIK